MKKKSTTKKFCIPKKRNIELLSDGQLLQRFDKQFPSCFHMCTLQKKFQHGRSDHSLLYQMKSMHSFEGWAWHDFMQNNNFLLLCFAAKLSGRAFHGFQKFRKCYPRKLLSYRLFALELLNSSHFPLHFDFYWPHLEVFCKFVASLLLFTLLFKHSIVGFVLQAKPFKKQNWLFIIDRLRLNNSKQYGTFYWAF